MEEDSRSSAAAVPDGLGIFKDEAAAPELKEECSTALLDTQSTAGAARSAMFALLGMDCFEGFRPTRLGAGVSEGSKVSLAKSAAATASTTTEACAGPEPKVPETSDEVNGEACSGPSTPEAEEELTACTGPAPAVPRDVKERRGLLRTQSA